MKGSVAPKSSGAVSEARRGSPWLCAVLLSLLSALSLPVAAEPQRIITLGGAVTEIVFALDAGAAIVATDASSLYPEAARRLPKVGYFRVLTIEPLLALRPDLLLASEHAGPPRVLEQLERAGVRVVRIPEQPSPAGVTAKIEAVAAALDREAAGTALAQRVGAALAEVQAHHPRAGAPPSVLFLLSAGPQGLMAAGRDTAANALISLLGARNVFAAHSGYAPASAEALAGNPLDYVLISARSLAALGDTDAVLALPGLGSAALDAGRIIAVDDLGTLAFGPRLPAGLADIEARMGGTR